MERENFRILLDLSDLEDRVHKYVWMLISTIDLKYVADLKRAVIKKLALDRNDINMFINGGLLLEEEKIMILRENDTVQIKYEKLSNSICHSSSYIEMHDSRLSLNTEDCNGNFKAIVKRSKKKKIKSEMVALDVADEDEDLSKRKRKRDVAADAILERCEDDILVQPENPMRNSVIEEEGICNVKKKKCKKSCRTSTEKNVIIKNESTNEEIDTMLAAVDAVIPLDKSFQESKKIEENSISKPTDVAVESFIQGSNCKKRKRKRRRKPKIEQNSIGSFMSENISTSNKLPKEDPPICNPCDNFAGIRKHIRFTSPSPEESNNKKMETVQLETYCLDSQAEISSNKTCISPNAKLSSVPTRKMYIDNANQIANKVYSKCSTSPNNTYTLPNVEIPSLSTSTTYIDHAYKTTPKILNEACITTSSKTLLSSTNMTFGNVANSIEINPKMSTPTKQKSLAQNSWGVSPMQRENGKESSPQVTTSKERDTTKHAILRYADYPPLNALPSMGMHVAFKLLELDENYSPAVSTYKEGVIKSINPKTDELEIELTNAEIKPGRIGKFENLNEDEAPLDEVIRTVMAPWSSLIEPKLISCIRQKNYV